MNEKARTYINRKSPERSSSFRSSFVHNVDVLMLFLKWSIWTTISFISLSVACSIMVTLPGPSKHFIWQEMKSDDRDGYIGIPRTLEEGRKVQKGARFVGHFRMPSLHYYYVPVGFLLLNVMCVVSSMSS